MSCSWLLRLHLASLSNMPHQASPLLVALRVLVFECLLPLSWSQTHNDSRLLEYASLCKPTFLPDPALQALLGLCQYFADVLVALSQLCKPALNDL